MSKHYVGETGTEIRLNCGVDVSGATATYIYCRKPDGTTTTWTASLYGTNYLSYSVVSGDFDQPGVYRVQSGVTLASWTGRGETAIFEITPLWI